MNDNTQPAPDPSAALGKSD